VTSELEFKAKLWILKIVTKLRFELQYPITEKFTARILSVLRIVFVEFFSRSAGTRLVCSRTGGHKSPDLISFRHFGMVRQAHQPLSAGKFYFDGLSNHTDSWWFENFSLPAIVS
jgi:hypothetical protein